MKVSCPVSYLPGDTFAEKLDILRRLGYDAVELATTYCEGREEEILRVLNRQAVPVSAYWGLVKGCISPLARERKAAVERLRRALQFAAECGAGKVVWVDHCLAAGQTDTTTAYKHLLASLANLIDIGTKVGAVVAVEPLSWRDRALIASTDDGLRLCRQIGSPIIRLNLDTYHMAVAGEDPATSLRQAMTYTAHIHFSDFVPPREQPKRPFPGDGTLDFKAYADALAEARYSDPICVEGAIADWSTIEDRLRRTLRFTKTLGKG